jgi:glycosyltransferase involved in cell wall biosynthesis
MARVQVGLVGQTGATDLRRHFPRQSCPIKLFDYASCGLPLVAPPGEWSHLIEEFDCGVIASRCEPEAFLEAIAILEDNATWERVARNAKRLVSERFQWKHALAPLVSALDGDGR